MDRQSQYRMTYFIYCINAFAERYHLTPKQAFAYLHRFKDMEFLDECYEAEHQLSINDAVDDLTIICKRNGGGIGIMANQARFCKRVCKISRLIQLSNAIECK